MGGRNDKQLGLPYDNERSFRVAISSHSKIKDAAGTGINEVSVHGVGRRESTVCYVMLIMGCEKGANRTVADKLVL